MQRERTAAPQLHASELDSANAFGEFLRLAVHEKPLPATPRVQAAAGCLIIAQDHHHAVVVLLGSRIYASVFALIRIQFEACIRGEWLSLCATDLEVTKFLRGDEPPKLSVMISALEQKAAFQDQILSKIRTASWASMCGYTHTGGLHVQRYLTPESIESSFARTEILEVLNFSEIIVSLSVMGVLLLAQDEIGAISVMERFKARMLENENFLGA